MAFMNEDVTRTEWDGRTPGCAAPDVLLAFHRGRLRRPQRKEVRRHLRRCPECARDSEFVAIIVRDESRLLRGLAALLPGCRETIDSAETGVRRITAFRPPRPVAAAVAIAGIFLALFILPPFRRTSPAAPMISARLPIGESGLASAPPVANGVLSKRRDVRERLVRAGFLLDPDFGPAPEAIPDVNRALASFEILQKRDGDDEFFGWSLAFRPEGESAYSVLSPR
jgi:hypothetical protein